MAFSASLPARFRLTLPRLSLSQVSRLWLSLCAPRREGWDMPEEDRTRRDFIREMMARSPEAFSSDLDVQSFMLHFPHRF